MANPIIPGIPQTEQDLLYSKLNAYNQGRASYKEVGAYLIVLPRPEHLQYTLWIYSPLPGRQSIFYICDLSTDIHETLRMASTLCFYSPRSLLLVEYMPKNAEQRGRHYLHRQIPRAFPARNSPYRPCLSYVDSLQIPATHPQAGTFRTDCQDLPFSPSRHTTRKRTKPPVDVFWGRGEKVENLTLTVLSVRLEDNPYKTQLKGTTPYFYVRQVLKLKDSVGNFVSIRMNARTASRKSCQLPAVEHAYQVGEIMEIASARIARTYMIGSTKYTRLTHVKLHVPTG